MTDEYVKQIKEVRKEWEDNLNSRWTFPEV